jgi:hypothetical protein
VKAAFKLSLLAISAISDHTMLLGAAALGVTQISVIHVNQPPGIAGPARHLLEALPASI